MTRGVEMDPIAKWQSCRSSLTVSIFSGDEAGQALMRDGYILGYNCEHPSIVAQSPIEKIRFLIENGRERGVAVLYYAGKPENPTVKKKITETCGKCPHYQVFVKPVDTNF